MLRRLHLENFKCFRNQHIVFNKLTLLTGVNSAGKSTVIQSLLMTQQTLAERWPNPTIQLSGELVNLGLPKDVLYSTADEDSFSILIERDTMKFNLRATLQNNKLTTDCTNDNDVFSSLFYLNAERICPRTIFPIPTDIQTHYNPIGNHGDYAAYTLYERGEENISCHDVTQANLLVPENRAPSASLLQQTEGWLSTLGAPVRLQTARPVGTDDVVLRFSFPDISGNYYRPTNVGFGLTYTLPIFVAVLSAKPGSLIIIENPEAHLHPKGQAIMGRFLARAAACGIQLVVETHSDHVLNGIRMAVKRKELSHDAVQINFFSHDAEGVRVETPRIDADGHIDQWPDDFFDEWDKQLAALL